MSTYTLFCTYEVKPNCRDAFVGEMESSGTAEKIRREDGCLRYEYTYPVGKPDTVLLIEEWESKAHQQIHVTQPHIAELRKIKEKYVLSTELKPVE